MKNLINLESKRVDFVVYPGFKALEAIGTMSVFEYANLHLAQQGRPQGYQLNIVSVTAGPVPSDTQMVLEASGAVSVDDLPHTAIIIGARQIEQALELSLIHISEPTRRTPISYAVF